MGDYQRDEGTLLTWKGKQACSVMLGEKNSNSTPEIHYWHLSYLVDT